jgi:bromodomain-containing protein 7/9
MTDKSYDHSEFSEKHKKSKKKKKKKDREKKHKHHKKDRHHKRESSVDESAIMDEDETESMQMYYSSMTTSSAVSSNPVTKPMIPLPPQEQKSFHTLQNVQNIPTTPTSSSEHRMDIQSSQLSPMTPPSVASSSNDPNAIREPRTCVLKLKQSRSPIAKLLDHLLKAVEKKDPHQFFAWPVTDDIAPGYSAIITKPMDFSTIRQKIEENKYSTLMEFSDDFQLMCENAIKYNHHETVYNKAARRLLQGGMKIFTHENLARGPYQAFIKDLTIKELGFDPTLKLEHHDEAYSIDSMDYHDVMGLGAHENDPMQEEREKRERMKAEMDPKSPFEPFVDAMTADEVLEQVQRAAKEAKSKLNKRKASSMGFLRTHFDGTTSMKIVLPSTEDGVPEKTKKLGEFTGKLEKGTGLLQSFREDRRNNVKLPKVLKYGSFSSFAPTFDSRFTNLSVEETELILNTYGDENGANYATSISRFTDDSVYGSSLANKLLDLLTNGEHSKTMETLIESEQVKQNQIEVDKMMPNYNKEAKELESVTINFDELKSLKDIGIDTSFLNVFEKVSNGGESTKEENLENKLNTTSSLIEQLHQVQNARLSAPPPQHLGLITHPSNQEMELADEITFNITNIAKKLQPGAIASVPGIQRAIGVNVKNPESDFRKTASKFNAGKSIDVDMDLETTASEFDNFDDIRKLLG